MTQDSFARASSEEAGYFKVSGGHLYTVLHRTANPVASILLVGPFASERHHSYLPWVGWARYLAARGIEVLRYDYRGIGESTGVFNEMTFEDWREDVDLLASWLRRRRPNVPLILHGLELGAILAGKTFSDGMGDAMLLWSPPVNANQALRSTLLRWVGIEQLLKYTEERKPGSAYIEQIENGLPLEVEGYEWSSRLWLDSFAFEMPAGLLEPSDTSCPPARPVKTVQLGKKAAPLSKKGFVEYDEIRDMTWLHADNFDWITMALNAQCAGGADAPAN